MPSTIDAFSGEVAGKARGEVWDFAHLAAFQRSGREGNRKGLGFAHRAAR
ncbi:MAG: hypothetical protein AAGB97_08810 [Dehalococcoidia bacterium]